MLSLLLCSLSHREPHPRPARIIRRLIRCEHYNPHLQARHLPSLPCAGGSCLGSHSSPPEVGHDRHLIYTSGGIARYPSFSDDGQDALQRRYCPNLAPHIRGRALNALIPSDATLAAAMTIDFYRHSRATEKAASPTCQARRVPRARSKSLQSRGARARNPVVMSSPVMSAVPNNNSVSSSNGSSGSGPGAAGPRPRRSFTQPDSGRSIASNVRAHRADHSHQHHRTLYRNGIRDTARVHSRPASAPLILRADRVQIHGPPQRHAEGLEAELLRLGFTPGIDYESVLSAGTPRLPGTVESPLRWIPGLRTQPQWGRRAVPGRCASPRRRTGCGGGPGPRPSAQRRCVCPGRPHPPASSDFRSARRCRTCSRG